MELDDLLKLLLMINDLYRNKKKVHNFFAVNSFARVWLMLNMYTY